MDEIVASVQRVTDIIGEIAAARRSRARGIEQVNKAITQMDEVTQQNAALVRGVGELAHLPGTGRPHERSGGALQGPRRARGSAAAPGEREPAGRTPLPETEPKPRLRTLPKSPAASQTAGAGADDEWKEF